MTTPATKSAREPAMARPNPHCTTNRNDSVVATTMTRPLAQILASMISVGVRGITSRCSIVPCSRSRIRAVPARNMARRVMLLTSCTTPMKGETSRFGLNCTRMTRATGGVAVAAGLPRKAVSSWAMLYGRCESVLPTALTHPWLLSLAVPVRLYVTAHLAVPSRRDLDAIVGLAHTDTRGKKCATDLEEHHRGPDALLLYTGQCSLERYRRRADVLPPSQATS